MKVLDTVALLNDLPDQGLLAGSVGVIVEEWQPGLFEVEFADLEGRAYALVAIESANLLPLHHSWVKAA